MRKEKIKMQNLLCLVCFLKKEALQRDKAKKRIQADLIKNWQPIDFPPMAVHALGQNAQEKRFFNCEHTFS